MVIQAGAARMALDKRPDDARTALGAIERTGRQAMTDMRRMLGVLVEAGASGPGGPARPRADARPRPARVTRRGGPGGGSPVALRVEGTPTTIDPGVSLSAYRIVQESLTNVLKHAPGARAEVVLRYAPRAVDLEISDAGGPPDRARSRRVGETHLGLVGMRERAALYGGTLEAGPTPTGFRVAAHLPIDPTGSAA